MDLDLSFDDQLAAIARAHKPDPAVAYFEPEIFHHHMGVLIPVGYQWFDNTVEFYWHDAMPMGKASYVNYVFHGHDRQGTRKSFMDPPDFCNRNAYCHVLGYEPTGAESPKFIRNFYKKWKYLNKSVQQELRFG